MSKYHKIRWQQSDYLELTRAVKNFNAKITRLGKKNPEIKNALPEKASVRQLKELIATRNDLKREINSLRRFSKKGQEELVLAPDNEYNLKITKWQRNEINRRVAIVNRRRAKRYQDIANQEMTSRGEPLGYTRGQLGMGRLEEVALRPLKGFTRAMNRSDLQWKWKVVLSESQSDYFDKKDFRARDNYLKGLKIHYNWEDIKDIYQEIENMDIREFLNIFNREGATFEISSPVGKMDRGQSDYEGYVSALRSTWKPNKRG